MWNLRKLIGATALAAALVAIPTAASGTPGSGNGNATGRPADGSVGNADDKAPGGQSPDDPNAGYECDRNHGVGQGNPAHTGCDTTTTVEDTTTTEATTTTLGT
jgi:hypothetical protein